MRRRPKAANCPYRVALPIPGPSRRRRYELAVVVMVGTGGGIEFVCCARPRFSSAAFRAAKCQQLAELLQSAVVSLALDEGDAA